MALWIPIREAGSLDHFRIRISIGNAGCMERDQFTWDRRIGALISNGNLDQAPSCNWPFFFNSINVRCHMIGGFFFLNTREAEDELRGGISCIGWNPHKSGKLGWGLLWGCFFLLHPFSFS